MGGVDTETSIGSDGSRSEVEGIASALRNPTLLEEDELLDELDAGLGVDATEGHSLHGGVHSLHVIERSEKTNVTIVVEVGLHALEALEIEGPSGEHTSMP